MKSRLPFALRLAYSLCGLGGFLCWAANAQSPAPAPAAAAAPVYQDRYIGGGSLSPDISMGDNSTSNTDGLAHSLQIDAVASVLTSHDSGSGSQRDGERPHCQDPMGNGGVRRLVARRGAAHRCFQRRPLRAGPGRRRHPEAARHAVRWRLAGGQCARRREFARHRLARLQPRFYLPTAPLAGAHHGMARPVRPAGRRRRRHTRRLRRHRGAQFSNSRRIDRDRRCTVVPGLALDGGRTARRRSRREPRHRSRDRWRPR